MHSKGILETLVKIPADLTFDVAVLGDSYSMSAKHKNSERRYGLNGPGGSIEIRPSP